ncbi:hypothetical protein [Sphingomonas sp. PWP1-2]|uniref:hypothetical protein n=1 Tax=Sphingomonas sp. PWP1-2 TaxID=2804558 RepID=UPI003CEABDBB
MGMQDWCGEANRLLDARADTQAEVRAMHERAKVYREQRKAANDRARADREAFDGFMQACMTVRLT